MARYIDADEILKHKRKMKDFGISPEDDFWDYAVLEEDITNAPTADVVEVENVNKTIDDLITEIHCLEAKCRKYEEEIARLKIIIKEMSEEDI